MARSHILIGLAVAACTAVPVFAQIAVRNQGYIPYSEPPINYRSAALSDPVALLEKDIEAGKTSLTYEPEHGYLKSVLALLKVPVESQTLVFSKTSFQYPKISPQHPRALYYNDDVYVGRVHDGNAIEIVSFDPKQGAIFYLVDERKVDKPVFQRAELDCTQCHIAAGTRGVPGVLLRSVFPTATGTLTPRSPSYITDQESPLKQRWGGWYVTGRLAKASMANATTGEPQTGPLPTAVSTGTPAPPQLSPLGEKPYDTVRLSRAGQRPGGAAGADPSGPDAQSGDPDQLPDAAGAVRTGQGSRRPEAIADATALDSLPEATQRQNQEAGRPVAALPALRQRDVAGRAGCARADQGIRRSRGNSPPAASATPRAAPCAISICTTASSNIPAAI